MALLFIDGFEQYASQATVSRGGWAIGSTLAGVPVTGRQGAGSRAVRLAFSSTGYLRRSLLGNYSSLVFGFAYYAQATVSSHDALLTYSSDGNEQIILRVVAGGELAVYRGSTLLATSSGANLTADTWHYIEFKFTINNSTGSYAVRLNGNNVLSDSNVDTQNDASLSTVAFFDLLGHSTSDPWFDDLYVCDDSGAANNDFLGDCVVETLFPDADGATNNFTPDSGTNNYSRVDDGATPDDDTSYVSSSTAADKDLYGFAALQTANITDIYGVQVAVLGRKEDAGNRVVRTVARSNVTETDGPDQYLATDYQYYFGMYETDPNGGGAWSESSVNAAQFGMKIQS